MAFPIRIAVKDGGGDCGDRGPWFIGGSYYVVAKSATNFVDVYKSPDLVTWTLMDGLNDPQDDGGSWQSLIDGTLIHIVAVGSQSTNDSRYHVTTFDTATDTWGVSGPAGPTINEATREANEHAMRAVLLTNGDIYLFYSLRVGGDATRLELRYIAYSSGAWGTSAVLVAAPSTAYYNFFQSVCADSNNLMYVFFKQNTDLSYSGVLQYVTLTTSGTIVGPTAIDADNDVMLAGHPTQWGTDKIALPYYNSSGFTGVYIGTPLATPVWTFTLLNTLTWGANIADNSAIPTGPAFRGAFAFVDSGTLYVVWATSNTTDLSTNRIYYAANSGSGWSSPQLIWDEVTDPPSWIGGNTPYLSEISAGIHGSTIAIALDINCEGAGIGNTAEIIVVVPIVLICNSPPSGITGVSYTHQLGLSGGVPPYTVTITVGALPTGLSISDTGLITGTPTVAGSFQFTVHVVDSVGTIANVTCTIVIVQAPASGCPDADIGGPG